MQFEYTTNSGSTSVEIHDNGTVKIVDGNTTVFSSIDDALAYIDTMIDAGAGEWWADEALEIRGELEVFA